jgi:hypothetical protein
MRLSVPGRRHGESTRPRCAKILRLAVAPLLRWLGRCITGSVVDTVLDGIAPGAKDGHAGAVETAPAYRGCGHG